MTGAVAEPSTRQELRRVRQRAAREVAVIAILWAWAMVLLSPTPGWFTTAVAVTGAAAAVVQGYRDNAAALDLLERVLRGESDE